MTDLPQCDFCTERTDTPKCFNGWVACGVCSRMIDAKRWQALLEYALCSIYINNPKIKASEQELREAVTKLHRNFRESQ